MDITKILIFMASKTKTKPQFLPVKDFPLLDKYKETFPIDENTAFPYDHTIYTDLPLTPDLIIHEEVHFKQQDEIGLDNWIVEYFVDVNFRVKMEVEAYREQVKYFADNKDVQDMIRVQCAKALSSNLYGNILTYKEAHQQLK